MGDCQACANAPKRIGTQLEFWSGAGAGTEVQLTVPASVAYEISHDGVGSTFLRKIRNQCTALIT